MSYLPSSFTLDSYQFTILALSIALSTYLSKTASDVLASLRKRVNTKNELNTKIDGFKKEQKDIPRELTNEIKLLGEKIEEKRGNLQLLLDGDIITMFFIILVSIRLLIWFVHDKLSHEKFTTLGEANGWNTFFSTWDALIISLILIAATYMFWVHRKQWLLWIDNTSIESGNKQKNRTFYGDYYIHQ